MRKLPSGTTFSMMQATVQAWQPMHWRASTSMPQWGLAPSAASAGRAAREAAPAVIAGSTLRKARRRPSGTLPPEQEEAQGRSCMTSLHGKIGTMSG